MRNAAAVALLPLVVALLAGQAGESPAPDKTAAAEAVAKLLRTDSRAPYVHRLTLYDHDGQAIDPADENAKPYSPKMTCGKCHAYAEIACGWHFNSGSADVAGFAAERADGGAETTRPALQHGRPGEPWILADARLGVQIPISTRDWPGTFTPAQVGLSNWQFTLHFGRQLAGGGLSEPDAKTIAASAEAKRWAISGTLEIDCMVCHATMASGYDPGEIERQVERQNLRWSPTAALGLGIIRGDARGVSNDFDPESPGSVDRPDLTLPKVQYDKARFDGDNRVHFDIVGDPPSERCYHCHSTRHVGGGALPDWQRELDVHVASGLSCTDCHRHGIDHNVVRGVGDGGLADLIEKKRQSGTSPRMVPGPLPDDLVLAAGIQRRSLPASFSCAGCHSATGPTDPALDGRLGAPVPEHAGIPPLHFEKLSCTACHSGPWPEYWTRSVQTSMSHALGVSSKERREDALPDVVEPVFIGRKQRETSVDRASGAWRPELITPTRMLWPAYWGKRGGDIVEPLSLDLVTKAAGRALPKVKGASFEQTPGPLSDSQIEQTLTTLKPRIGENAEPVYIRDGRIFSLSPDGKLASRYDDGGAGAYFWPLAHDVRPAQQSLGVRGCTDCHESSSPIFFGRTTTSQPSPAGPPDLAMRELHGDSPVLVSAWAVTFGGREAFKWFGWILVAVTMLALLRQGGSAGGQLAIRGTNCERLASGLLCIAILAQTATSFGAKWLGGSVSGWMLLIHASLAPLFLIGLALTAVLRAQHCRLGVETPMRLSAAQKLLFWVIMPLGVIVAATMLAAMLPLFGTVSMRWLVEVHEVAGLLLLIATVAHLVASAPRAKSAA